MGEPLPTVAGGFKAILVDPPWGFKVWRGAGAGGSRATKPHYETMTEQDMNDLGVGDSAAVDSVLFLWSCWPILKWSLRTIEAWGFEYKTCAFCWVKAHARQIEMFQDDIDPHMTLGYWTRSNSEVCLLATRGKPKRRDMGVKQAIIEPRREHSRKPDCVHQRIERLVEGPYLELFARQSRPGWVTWGNEATKFDPISRAAE